MDLQQKIETTIADFNLNDMPARRTAKRIMQLIKDDKGPQAASEAVSAELPGCATICRGDITEEIIKKLEGIRKDGGCIKCKTINDCGHMPTDGGGCTGRTK